MHSKLALRVPPVRLGPGGSIIDLEAELDTYRPAIFFVKAWRFQIYASRFLFPASDDKQKDRQEVCSIEQDDWVRTADKEAGPFSRAPPARGPHLRWHMQIICSTTLYLWWVEEERESMREKKNSLLILSWLQQDLKKNGEIIREKRWTMH
jgi:hypothetical protein